MFTALENSILMLLASVITVAILRRFQMPALLGYLLVGVCLAPVIESFSGDFTQQSEAFNALAHFGVVFLMFSIGLEFSLSKLNAMRNHVFFLGGLQVGLTMIAGLVVLILPVAVVTMLFAAQLDWRAGFVLAGGLAMSSTALIAKLLSERREIETEHGQRVMGVLLFQDLAVIPILVLLPTIAGQQGDWQSALGFALLKAVVILVLLFRYGRAGLRAWFMMVARTKSHELFTLNVLLVTLVAGWLTYKAGLSMELGAFVAGMLIGETEFRHQVEEDIKPFRDVLLGLFFIALGMRLDWGAVIANFGVVVFLVVVPMLFKFALVYALVRAQKASLPTAARTALYLAQAGEFGLVVLTQGFDLKLLPEATMQIVLAAMLLSLLLSSILLANSDRLLMRFSQDEWLERSLQLQAIARRGLTRKEHIVICGYGRSGQSVAHVLETESVSFVALDLDPDRVTEANAAGESVVFGDAQKRETLVAAGIHRARALIISVNDTELSLRILHLVREIAPQLPVVVRTGDHQSIDVLREAGAAEVIPEVVEGSLLLASHALVLAGVQSAKVQARMGQIRSDRYSLLSSYIHGDDEHDEIIEGDSRHLRTIRIGADSALVNCAIGDLPLDDLRITALTRNGQRQLQPDHATVLLAGDVLVVSGGLSQIENFVETAVRAD